MDFWTQSVPLHKIYSPTVLRHDGNDASSTLQKEALLQALGDWHFWQAF